jgi:hypothetical protein
MQEVAQLQAQLRESALQLQELEAQLQDKVQCDAVLKQSRREQWDRKKYKDTLLNMSFEMEVRCACYVQHMWLGHHVATTQFC